MISNHHISSKPLAGNPAAVQHMYELLFCCPEFLLPAGKQEKSLAIKKSK